MKLIIENDVNFHQNECSDEDVGVGVWMNIHRSESDSLINRKTFYQN